MARQSYSNEDVTRILEQVLLHQCACPSQLCRMVLGLRELLQYERDCLDHTSTDVQVHQTIEQAAGQCLEIMEACLGQGAGAGRLGPAHPADACSPAGTSAAPGERR